MALEARTNLEREGRVRRVAPAGNFGEKMGGGESGRFGGAASRFGAGANLGGSVGRWVAVARRKKVAKGPWGSARAADAWQLRRLENFRASGDGSGGRLPP